MFHESLLESSSQFRKGKRWPMAAAFAGEVIVGAVVVMIPLLSTGVIRVSAHVAPIAHLGSAPVIHDSRSEHSSNSGTLQPAHAVVTVGRTNSRSIIGRYSRVEDSGLEAPPNIPGDPRGVPNFPLDGGRGTLPSPPPVSRRLKVSELSEAQLLNKVEPVYPRIAILTGRQGDVRLHAFIAKDGTIERLNVLSGDPMLVPAAVAAVRQWRYRPYLLNGEPVEVETFITVSFKGIRD